MKPLKDITEFRDHYGTEQMLESLVKNSKPFTPTSATTVQPEPELPVLLPELKLPAIINAQELIRRNPHQPPQLIRGLLHQGSKMVLGGGSKSYKTWSLLDLGMSVACGQLWWGFDTTRTKVLYINLELPDWSFKERIESITTVRPELADLSRFDVWNLRGYAVSLEKLQPIIAQAAAQNYGLIIIDPIYKVYGDRDENSAGDMGELLNEIDRLAVKTDAAVVFGAHFSKGNQAGKESMDRISGSGVFARDPDTILIMTKHEQEDTYTVEATVRNLKPVDPFCVQRDHPLMKRNDEIDPKRLKQAGNKKEIYTVGQLMDALGADELTTTEWQTRTCDTTEMSPRTFQAKLEKVKKAAGMVTKVGDKWKATYPPHVPEWKKKAAAEQPKTEEVQQCN